MKRLFSVAFLVINFQLINAQPPGSPKDMPGSDTSTVEMDGGKLRNKQTVQRSDTARLVPNPAKADRGNKMK